MPFGEGITREQFPDFEFVGFSRLVCVSDLFMLTPRTGKIGEVGFPRGNLLAHFQKKRVETGIRL